MRRRRYVKEFKKEAARLLIVDGQTVRETSEQLGVSENQLYRWKGEFPDELEGSKSSGEKSPKEMAEEIARLRKEPAKSRRMNAILKKTVSYFSEDE